ncbi:hypothetical protein AAFN47_24215 [Hoeflea sp. CAU 1731]
MSALRLGATIVVLYGLFQTIMFASTQVASPIWHYTQWQAGARNLLHFLSTPLVLPGYNTVSFAALHILAWKGKSVCPHDISGKTGLPPSEEITA